MCIVVDRKRDECDTRFVLGTNMRRRSSEHESSSSEFLSRAQTYTIDLLLGIGGLLAQQSLQMLCNRHVAVSVFWFERGFLARDYGVLCRLELFDARKLVGRSPHKTRSIVGNENVAAVFRHFLRLVSGRFEFLSGWRAFFLRLPNLKIVFTLSG